MLKVGMGVMVGVGLMGVVPAALAQHEVAKGGGGAAFVAGASDEGLKAIRGFLPVAGFKVDLVAAEPLLANPVSFTFDERGRIYVAETFRLHAGVGDIREIMPWLDEDLACRTVEDRLAMMRRQLGAGFSSWVGVSDRVKRLVDRDGDGRMDEATVFADGFKTALSGIGAGVLARGGKVWYANIPDLWLLEDQQGTGVSDRRRSLSHGYGVRVGFLGHDLHGLCFGPDGKLYFSIGDRGASVPVGDHRVGDPDTGSVFRCEPDGSGLEVYATGLRNPQELAFDAEGNLFTGDNNSDGGDQARWVFVVEGGDSGWRVGYQFLERPNSRGPWNSERMWHPQWEGQAAFLVPPVANLASGPSGTAFYPGTGLPSQYRDHFFLTDFRGGKGSGIHAFRVEPAGAGFKLEGRHNFIWDCLPTDVEFGPMGGVYFSDWVAGWEMTGKGRIYRVYEPSSAGQPLVAEVARLLREGMRSRSGRELAGLLGHVDLRVRQAAQFELAGRGPVAVKGLAEVARTASAGLARLHAIWGLGQVGARVAGGGLPFEGTAPLIKLLGDPEVRVRAQAAKVLSDLRVPEAYEPLVALVKDSSPKVRMFAVQGLGRLGRVEGVPAILGVLRDNADADPYLRHAASLALARIGDQAALERAAGDGSPSVRMGVLLAWRRMGSSDLERFLRDPDPLVVLEAARAIHDVPLSGGMKALASLAGDEAGVVRWLKAVEGGPAARSGVAGRMSDSDFQQLVVRPLAARVLDAQLRCNTVESAQALAQVAQNDRWPAAWRAEAIDVLAQWPATSGRDRITGLWRPIASPHQAEVAVASLSGGVTALLTSGPEPVRVAAARAVGSLRLSVGSDVVAKLASDAAASRGLRVASLRSLAQLEDPRLGSLVESLGKDPDGKVREETIRIAGTLKGSGVPVGIRRALESGTLTEKQGALSALATLPGEAAEAVLAGWGDRLIAGGVEPGLRLDVLLAMEKRDGVAMKERVQKYEAGRASGDPLAAWRECLEGGNAEAGRRVFLEKPEASCVRCHRVKGEGGEVGPELTGVGTRQAREYLLESIVLPNAKIAQGFETVLVTLKNGTLQAGVMKGETAETLTLLSPEDGLLKIQKADIKSRERGASGMPEGLAAAVGREELRNLIEFLSSLK